MSFGTCSLCSVFVVVVELIFCARDFLYYFLPVLPTPSPLFEILRDDGGPTIETTVTSLASERFEAKVMTGEVKVRRQFSDHWIWELFDKLVF